MTLPAEEFIRRFLLHVLPTGFQRIRHYGLLANRSRQAKLARCRQLLAVPLLPIAVTVLQDARTRCERLLGRPVNRCPRCQAASSGWKWSREAAYLGPCLGWIAHEPALAASFDRGPCPLSAMAEPESAAVCLLGVVGRKTHTSWPSGAANQTAKRTVSRANRLPRQPDWDFLPAFSALTAPAIPITDGFCLRFPSIEFLATSGRAGGIEVDLSARTSQRILFIMSSLPP